MIRGSPACVWKFIFRLLFHVWRSIRPHRRGGAAGESSYLPNKQTKYSLPDTGWTSPGASAKHHILLHSLVVDADSRTSLRYVSRVVGPRGGGRQRRQQLEAALQCGDRLDGVVQVAANSKTFDSALCRQLLKDWSWGLRSASTVQWCAYSAFQDEAVLVEKIATATSHTLGLDPSHFRSKTLASLARLGSFGRHKNHCHRDLLVFFGDCPSPDYERFDIEVKLQKPLRWMPATKMTIKPKTFVPLMAFNVLL